LLKELPAEESWWPGLIFRNTCEIPVFWILFMHISVGEEFNKCRMTFKLYSKMFSAVQSKPGKFVFLGDCLLHM
jgi:hypothetical protein